MKTFITKKEKIKYKWYLVNAEGKNLGRISTEISRILLGKHKKEYTPYIDIGDYIIVINSKKININSKKKKKKIYYHHSGYIGGIKKITLEDMITRYPDRVIKRSVKGMLPKGPLGRKIFRKLKVYSGSKHNHAAQKPLFLNI